MRLLVDFGNYGFNEEYEKPSEAIKRLESIVDNSVIEIVVKKTASNEGGPFGSKDAL